MTSAVWSSLGKVSARVNAWVEEDAVLRQSRPYLAALGALSAGVVGVTAAYQLAKGITSYCLAAPLALGINVREYGEWAVVTGANAGIGKVFCLELARRGLNVVLIGRNEEKLQVAARDVELTHRVKTKVIVADLSTTNLAVYTDIQQQLTALKIAILVNNVGQGGDDAPFLENPPDSQGCLDLINTNTTAYVMMTRLILPGMLTRGRGIVVFLSSVRGDVPTPKSAVYSATKAFDQFFACALHEEYKERGIVVQCVMPGAVQTKMVQEDEKEGFWCVKPEIFVPSCIAQLGVRTRTYGHWKHALHIKIRKYIPGMNSK
ncbi:very-long-chain 3-oxoacyl-CoA reductase-A-like [Paramacrobiotus metropolitanus]|uniref:very-long-chain 3-oxoacyl-CoA reductase-A-like n=1 Tax=Paramacrobiotus metropolitanus TaxID=2943436 RepID=UPI002445F625|nr:very-long-chain 3-oxoacyl-CoA reductase-A-like [Paramacrobiotus metropolitanus]